METIIWGLDFGSRTVKIACWENGKITQTRIYETILFYKKCQLTEDGKLRIMDKTIGPAEDKPGQVVVTTGYGRNMVNLENAYQIPETMAHTLGAQYLTNLTDFLLVDIGGQDTKVILVEGGRINAFIMNDKCAASSGRYLENMARVLDVSLEELGQSHNNPVELNSTCAIFGESEVISKLVEGVPLSSICAGINYSLFRRLAPMLAGFFPLRYPILLSGGVAQNYALQKIIREHLNLKTQQLSVLPSTQLVGAIGCTQWYLKK